MSEKRIDWAQIKSRLAKTDEMLAMSLDHNEKRASEIQRRRAEYLASRRSAALAPLRRDKTVMVFALGEEHYAVDLEHIREVLPLSKWTPVPGSAAEIVGVMNVRSEVRTLWDLARLLGLPLANSPSSSYVLIVKKDGHEIGFRVDYVQGVREIGPNEITPLNIADGDASSRFFKGITDDRIILLKAEAVIGSIISAKVEMQKGGSLA